MDAIEMWELWEAENWSRLDTIARSTRQGRLYCCCFGFVFFCDSAAVRSGLVSGVRPFHQR